MLQVESLVVVLEEVGRGSRLRGSRLGGEEDIEVTAVGGLLEGHVGRGHGGGSDGEEGATR